jgi:hypothetical protein
MRLNKTILTLLLVLIPSTGWGMKCEKVNKAKHISRCVDKEVICYTYWTDAISCIKNQDTTE